MRKIIKKKVKVHIVHRQGMPVCGFTSGHPRDWPEGHEWAKGGVKANCKDCLKKDKSDFPQFYK